MDGNEATLIIGGSPTWRHSELGDPGARWMNEFVYLSNATWWHAKVSLKLSGD